MYAYINICIYIYMCVCIIIRDNVTYNAFTSSTPLRKNTEMFVSFGRFIGFKCHNYALCLCYIYIYIYAHIYALFLI